MMPDVNVGSGSLLASLLRLDGQVGAVVNAGKHMVEPSVVSSEMAVQLERIARQTGLSSGNGVVEQPGSARGFEPVKPGFTREVGSFRRQVPLHAVREPGK